MLAYFCWSFVFLLFKQKQASNLVHKVLNIECRQLFLVTFRKGYFHCWVEHTPFSQPPHHVCTQRWFQYGLPEWSPLSKQFPQELLYLWTLRGNTFFSLYSARSIWSWRNLLQIAYLRLAFVSNPSKAPETITITEKRLKLSAQYFCNYVADVNHLVFATAKTLMQCPKALSPQIRRTFRRRREIHKSGTSQGLLGYEQEFH